MAVVGESKHKKNQDVQEKQQHLLICFQPGPCLVLACAAKALGPMPVILGK
jgi:hypothetical protein